MTPEKKHQPSAHDVFVGKWKPTKNDTLSKRVPGFGATMNVLYGDQVCGQGDSESMSNIVSHYLYYLDLMGVGREEAGPHDVLTCAEQKPFLPTSDSSTSSSSSSSWTLFGGDKIMWIFSNLLRQILFEEKLSIKNVCLCVIILEKLCVYNWYTKYLNWSTMVRNMWLVRYKREVFDQ